MHPSGKIIALEQGGVPWKEHFFTIEKEQQLEAEEITYIIYADDSGDWRVQAIPLDDLQAFENRYGEYPRGKGAGNKTSKARMIHDHNPSRNERWLGVVRDGEIDGIKQTRVSMATMSFLACMSQDK